MDDTVVALVLAGGTGTRLYPATRSDRPKQLLALDDDRSLLERTVDRATFADEVYVLTNDRFADAVREAVPEAAVLTEPDAKDTGPALVYGTHRVCEQVGPCTVVAMPSDHRVDDADVFATTCQRAATVAADTERLVTIGVEPDRAATGYGYVEPGEEREGYWTVADFHEKPDAETAATYVQQGHYWNAGIFAWDAEGFLDVARSTQLGPLVDALERGESEDGFDAVDPVSVDYAVLERVGGAEDLAVVPAGFAWDDLGTWDAVARHLPTDEDGNAVAGSAVGGDASEGDASESDTRAIEGGALAIEDQVLAIDASGNVVATDGHVSLVGVEGLVVASYGDRTLVCSREETERVREVVERLAEEGRS